MDDESENLKAAFGESSDDEDLADRPDKGMEVSMVWERVEEINGLWLCRNFLSIAHQSDLLSAILNGTLFALLWFSYSKFF